MRAMWKGSVSFGLVTIPIQLYAATENKSVSLRQVHEADGGRIQYRRFCSVEDKEVPYAEIAKGYELSDGEMVILTDDDLAELPLSTSRAIDVLEFVPLESIDPIYYDKTYYLEPQKSAAKPYVLLRDALHKSGHVAIAKVAIRQRESLAVLRVVSDVLVMTTMLWPDEVRAPDFAFLREDSPQVRPQELTMAGSLIDSLSEPVFEPDKYHDSYREALESLIEAKVAGKETTKPRTAGVKAEVVDLMAALEASVSEAKKSRTPSAPRKTPAKRATKSTTKSTTTKAADKPAKKPTRGRRTDRSA
ncbi:DNA end-binding protein Ku [Amycolatopsis arida]|uniref:Non-homologous end joining protein Ku n=1 Tax=Amycolatopsis arida TaxID=587909 RepID=A0A1I5XE16_9PSEU|nr:Ku protein [Amycolatopsis arida]TDX97506.1 DNA end-binding protein Ku [Amycolatopsis arida]SFQ30223.1 DNA end-binding protein Ku [Amycolatopsis arida]